MVLNVATRPLYSNSVLAETSPGTSSVFLAEYLPGLAIPHRLPVPCLALWPPDGGSCTSHFKSQGHFSPSFLFLVQI